jgi:hypothetical protein
VLAHFCFARRRMVIDESEIAHGVTHLWVNCTDVPSARGRCN